MKKGGRYMIIERQGDDGHENNLVFLMPNRIQCMSVIYMYINKTLNR